MALNEEILIRDARGEDMEAIALLMTDLGYPTAFSDMQERLEKIFSHPDYRTLVAVMDDEIVGFSGLMKGLSFERSGKYLRIISFVVTGNARNKGIAGRLIKASEEWAVELGVDSVVISSGNRDERKAAHIFYQKMGYVIKSSGFFKPIQ
jgi:GNAT superfamily N-acetyltransferase